MTTNPNLPPDHQEIQEDEPTKEEKDEQEQEPSLEETCGAMDRF
jgi:hypothetical protein